MRYLMRTVLAAVVIVAVACAPPARSPASTAPAAAAAAGSSPAPPAASAPAAASFVNRVWRVTASNAVAPGQLYVFLSEGTLVIAAATGTPSLGTWSRDGAGLTMVEEGRPYRVEILALTADEWRLRIHGPGEPVDVTMVSAADAPAPPAARP